MEAEDTSENEYYEVPPKKMKTEWSKSYSIKAIHMMKKMGYETDKGLGKQSQGRLEPIVAFQQDGRRGLGLRHESVIGSLEHWDPHSDEICLPEKVSWLRNKSCLSLCNLQELSEWITIGEKKVTLNDETLFVDPDILNGILDAKTAFDQLNEDDLRRSRSRSNPFETIRSSIFQNRAAVKMANIDSMLGFMFTNPKDRMDNSLIDKDDLLYFADICAGPGGFSEYILYRKSWEAKGFGFTLRGANDFKLDKFSAGSPESFDPYYGTLGDGDIYVEQNQDSFADYIFKHCIGVHFVMADGGFSVEGQENIQEILSKQLYLCQCLTALKILRPNGSFVCKLFDIFTPFSIGLLYLMNECFEEFAIIKPNSSRPANSERYLICKWKKPDTQVICRYLNTINNHLNKKSDQDILEIVPFDVLIQNEEFYNYIKESNNSIGRNQIIGLQKIMAYSSNTELREMRQSECRRRCLELWGLPDKLRQAPENKSVEKFLEEFLNSWFEDKEWFNSSPTQLVSAQMLHKLIESIHDWYFVPIGRGESSSNACSFFICPTRGKLLRYTDMKKWEPLEYMFEISPKSLFYGEIVFEYNGQGRTQTKICTLHIIDAIMLGGKDVRRMPLKERMLMCSKFTNSINKPYKEGTTLLLRCKNLFKLENIDIFFNEMKRYTLKDGSTRLGIPLDESGSKFFVPGGVMMFCEIFHHFYSIMSKSQKMLYYFNKTKLTSYYKNDMPAEMHNILYSSFRNSFVRRLLWKWTNTCQVEQHSIKVDEKVLYRDDIVEFVRNKLSNM